MSDFQKEVLVFSSRFASHSYGPRHPLKVERLQLTMDLIEAYGLLGAGGVPWIEAEEAEEADLLRFHTPEYLEILKAANTGQPPPNAWKFGLGSGDNPVFPGLYDWSLLVTGATLECVRQVTEENREVAFNIGGGLHHALSDRASGFCYINDPAVGIARMIQEGLRVVYLDIDVHHGDGVEAAFYDTDRVLSISLHQHGHTLFPGTGFPDETGKGTGKGYSVNVPMAPGTDDELYLQTFKELVTPLVLAYDPDVLVTQLGADTHATDPLAAMNLTVDGFCRVIEEIKSWHLKWVALGGGGYNIVNVARMWTKAWAIMKGADIPDTLPQSFIDKHRSEVGQILTLSDTSKNLGSAAAGSAHQLATAVIEAVKQNIFPIIGA